MCGSFVLTLVHGYVALHIYASGVRTRHGNSGFGLQVPQYLKLSVLHGLVAELALRMPPPCMWQLSSPYQQLVLHVVGWHAGWWEVVNPFWAHHSTIGGSCSCPGTPETLHRQEM